MKRNLLKLISGALGAVIIATGISACSSDQNHKDTDDQTTEDSTQVEDVTEASEAPNYSLPSPLQIASIFKRSGLTYVDGLTNDVANSSNYSSNHSKSLNLGVYSSDLAYVVLNKQTQNAINYLKASKELANQIGIGSIFETNNLSTRFEANLSNEDSLASIITELQMESDFFLEDNEMQSTSAVIFAGAWVESMYIGAKVHESSKNEKVITRLIEQMTILDNLLKVLDYYGKSDNDIAETKMKLQEFHDTYNGLASVKNANTDSEEYVEIKLSEEEVTTLVNKAIDLRTGIVSK